MLIKYNESQYAALRPLYASLRYNLVVDSIIDGNTPAWVFADDPLNPRAALIWNRQDAMLLAGDARNADFSAAAGEVIGARIIPDAQSRWIPELTLHVDTDDWLLHRDLLFGPRPGERAARRYYQPGPLAADWRNRILEGCQVIPITLDDLRHASEIPNMEQVAGWVSPFWRSYEHFAAASFGYTVRQGAAVASWCLAVYASGAQFELGLATAPESRRRGFATLAAAACVEHCLSRGYTPHWHCWEDNAASIATAARVGFANPRQYHVMRIKI